MNITRKSVAALMGSAVLTGVLAVGGPAMATQGSSASGSWGATTQVELMCPHYPVQLDEWYGRDDGTSRSHSGVGSDGDRDFIKLVQRTLNTMDGDPNLEVDGYFGADTEEATKKMQRHLNQYGADLTVDGKWDDTTHFAASRAGWRPLCHEL